MNDASLYIAQSGALDIQNQPKKNYTHFINKKIVWLLYIMSIIMYNKNNINNIIYHYNIIYK